MTAPIRHTPALLSREDRVIRQLVREGLSSADLDALALRVAALELTMGAVLLALDGAGIEVALPGVADFSLSGNTLAALFSVGGV